MIRMGMGRLPGWIALLASCVPGPGADWLTDAGNVQRTNFQKDEKILSPDTVKGMQLLWKLHVENETRQMHALFPVLVVGRVNTAKGPKQIAIETGVSDNLYAIDVETGQLIWQKHFVSSWTPPEGGRSGGTLCPGGITATPLIRPAPPPAQYAFYPPTVGRPPRQFDIAHPANFAPPANF